jgi:hypothetical protein
MAGQWTASWPCREPGFLRDFPSSTEEEPHWVDRRDASVVPLEVQVGRCDRAVEILERRIRLTDDGTHGGSREMDGRCTCPDGRRRKPRHVGRVRRGRLWHR